MQQSCSPQDGTRNSDFPMITVQMMRPVWCFHDGKLCAIYDKQGRKIATAPIPIEDCACDGGYYWPQLGLYSAGDRIYATDGDCILQADLLRTEWSGNAIYIQRDGKWRVAMLHSYDGVPSAWAEPEINAAESAGICRLAGRTSACW